jgi:predicted RNA-binding protein YlxR (DUF448 family)
VVAPPATVVPDPARRMPGRGASLHPDPSCLVLAERRAAFGRALRVTGVLDIGPVREYVTKLGTMGTVGTVGSAGGVGTMPAPTEGK